MVRSGGRVIRRADVLLVLVLLLALGLRFYRIEAQSLWNDEGTSVALAQRDLLTIARSAARDIHPPLYYYLLHVWIGLWGTSELAVRSLSALLGTLLVLWTILLGRTLVSSVERGDASLYSSCGCTRADGLGLVAGLFAAVSPFLVYYAQEVRMYMLCACLGAASTWMVVRLLLQWGEPGSPSSRSSETGHRGQLWAGSYVLVSVLLLYTHYFAVTVILAQNLAFLCWLAAMGKRGTSSWIVDRLRVWVLLQLLVLVAYLPWLVLVREQLRAWPATSAPLQMRVFLLDLLRVFSQGLSIPARPNVGMLGFGVLLALGMIAPLWGGKRNVSRSPSSGPLHMTILLCLVVPIAVLYLMSLQRPMYNPKFLLLCAVPFALLLAQGALTLSSLAPPGPTRWLGLLLTLGGMTWVVISATISLRAYYFDPGYARDNYRGIARYIEALGVDGDVVLINAPAQVETFSYYYAGSLPVFPLPRQRPLDRSLTQQDLQQLVEGRKRVFAILWATDESDPERFIEGWLDARTYKAMDSWYGNVRLAVYAIPEELGAGGMEHTLMADLGGQVRLLGYSLPTAEIRSGDILQLTLYWQALTPMTERYKVFTHVLDSFGHLVGQRDAEPGGGARITTLWREGEEVVDNYGLAILPGTPPGEYLVEVGLYSVSDGLRLPVMKDGQPAGDFIVLQSVRVQPALASPPISVLDLTQEMDVYFQGIRLRGYSLTKLGFEHDPAAPLHPGDMLHLTLFWEATAQVRESVLVTLRLEDISGRARVERIAQPTEGLYPSTRWQSGELVRDQHNILLPPDLPKGTYRLTLAVQSLSTSVPLGSPTTLGRLTLQ